MTLALRILLADDHELVRKGIKSLLAAEEDFEVVGEAADGQTAIELTRRVRPDVILMDVFMPVCNGIEATRVIRKEFPKAKILMLTISEEDHYLFAAIREGAQGYLLKNVEPAELLAAIRGAARGDVPITPTLVRKVINVISHNAQAGANEVLLAEDLTRREREVLRMVAEGCTNKEIAQKLFISENTVKNHLRSIMDKLRCKNRAEAVTIGFRAGIITEDHDGVQEG